MVTLRRCEKYTNWEATKPFKFNPEDFRTLSETFDPYEGDSEAEFADYISDLIESTDIYEVCEELEQLDLTAAAETLSSLVEAELELYYSTTNYEEQAWIDQGVVDEAYRKTGGFRVDYSTFNDF